MEKQQTKQNLLSKIRELYQQKFSQPLPQLIYTPSQLQFLWTQLQQKPKITYSQIPLTPKTPPKDPRLNFPQYRQIFYIHNYNKPQNLNIVLNLQKTLVFSHSLQGYFSERRINQLIELYKQTYPRCQIKSLFISDHQRYHIVFFRSSLYFFLYSLLKVANLYVYNQGNHQITQKLCFLIDPEQQFFKKIISTNRKKSLRYLGLQKRSTLIIDHDIRNWEQEYQDIIIPSIRFASMATEPLLSISQDIFWKYIYFFQIPSFLDRDQIFLDKNQNQLQSISNLIISLHKQSFINFSSFSTAQALNQHRTSFLKNICLNISLIPNQIIQTVQKLIERFGGTTSQESENFLYAEGQHSYIKLFKMYFELFQQMSLTFHAEHLAWQQRVQQEHSRVELFNQAISPLIRKNQGQTVNSVRSPYNSFGIPQGMKRSRQLRDGNPNYYRTTMSMSPFDESGKKTEMPSKVYIRKLVESQALIDQLEKDILKEKQKRLELERKIKHL